MEERVVCHQQHPLGMDFSLKVLLKGGLEIRVAPPFNGKPKTLRTLQTRSTVKETLSATE